MEHRGKETAQRHDHTYGLGQIGRSADPGDTVGASADLSILVI